jgi:hypothetical protein
MFGLLGKEFKLKKSMAFLRFEPLGVILMSAK